MSRYVLDITGVRFGRLVAKEVHSRDKHGRAKWVCICDCGKSKIVSSDNLRRGNQSSCGCLRDEKIAQLNRSHGMSRTPTYIVWAGMIQRCENPSYTGYSYWGGRGIKVCERWKTFENFLADMGEKPKGKSIDRFPDNNGNYEPGNCRWASSTDQNRNRRSTVIVSFQGKEFPLHELTKKYGVAQRVVTQRIRRGWSIQVS